MSDSTQKKTCAGCGYLCAVIQKSQERVPVDATMRTEWEQPLPGSVPGGYYEDYPRCFVSAFPLEKESEEIQASMFPGPEVALKVIAKDREKCPRFRRWVPGLSMKEHLDMEYHETLQKIQEQRLEAEREHQQREKAAAEKREDARRQSDRELLERQKEADRAREEKRDAERDKREDERSNRSFWRGLITTAAGALIGTVLTYFVSTLTKKAEADKKDEPRPIIIHVPVEKPPDAKPEKKLEPSK